MATCGLLMMSNSEGHLWSSVGLGFRLETVQLFPSVPHTQLMNSEVQTLVI
jgi:hypothetical protein